MFSYANHDVLRNVSFSTQGGDFLSILGPNGVGKSTLFRCILGLLKPSSGSILLDGKPIDQYSSVQLARHIAYIPQSHNPVFNFSVQDMVLMGTTAQMGQFSLPGKEPQEQVACALERLGIAHLRDRGYGSISGGEPKEVYTSQLVSSLYGVEVEVCQVHEVRVAVPVGAGIKGENDEKG